MYKELQTLISQAMKEGDSVRLNTLRLTKAEFLIAEKNNIEITDSIEQKILSKMINQRQDSINQYYKANRPELAEKEQNEIGIIQQFVKKQPNEEYLKNYIRKCIDEYKETHSEMSIKNTKEIITIVRERYDVPIIGKLVSQIIKEYV